MRCTLLKYSDRYSSATFLIWQLKPPTNDAAPAAPQRCSPDGTQLYCSTEQEALYPKRRIRTAQTPHLLLHTKKRLGTDTSERKSNGILRTGQASLDNLASTSRRPSLIILLPEIAFHFREIRAAGRARTDGVAIWGPESIPNNAATR